MREIARKAVQARKAAKTLPLNELNSFLEHSVSHCLLSAKSRIDLHFERVYRQNTVEQYLAPVAESVAGSSRIRKKYQSSSERNQSPLFLKIRASTSLA